MPEGLLVVAQLRPSILWCGPEANWRHIELLILGRAVQSLLGCPSISKDLIDIHNQCFFFFVSLGIWLDRLVRRSFRSRKRSN